MTSLLILTNENHSRISPALAGEGLVMLVDKPETWTSFDAVNKIRYLLRKRLGVKKLKVGHAGTLDPMATGLLIICTGKYTSLLEGFQGQPKSYEGILTLGGETASYDRETPVLNPKPWSHLSHDEIQRVRGKFVGIIHQIPPVHSAIKVDGKRAYLLARKGKEVEMKSRQVEIYSFDFLPLTSLPEISFEVRCSKGTYIRSLAHDIGQDLGCGAYLSSLRRTAIGDYNVQDSLSIQTLTDWAQLPG